MVNKTGSKRELTGMITRLPPMTIGGVAKVWAIGAIAKIFSYSTAKSTDLGLNPTIDRPTATYKVTARC